MDDDHPALLLLATQAGALALPLYLALLALVLLAAWGLGRWLLPLLWRQHPLGEDGRTEPLRPLALLLRLGLGFLAILGCAALFAEIVEELHAERTLGLMDEAFITALAGQVPDGVVQVFYMFTFLGNPATLVTLAVLMGTLLWARGRRGLALGWLLGMAGNGLLNPALKRVFERARPEHPSTWLTEGGFSFPSGHSSGAVVTCGLLAYLGLRLLPRRWHVAVLMAAAGLAFSMGASRVFLRVHYPSDVLAGFATGSAWLAVCIASLELARWVRKRGHRRAGAPPRINGPG